MEPDAELLRRYAEEDSEPAFAALVQRHIGLVYSAALRQVGDPHRAQDVTQQVFTALARKARALAGREVIASWLYTSTRYIATNARRAEYRRQKYEQEALMHELTRPEPADDTWQRLHPLIDEVMHELTERDRTVVVLRFFENQAYDDIGASLGISEDAARMRVDRALEKLHLLLTRRRVTSTSAALAAVLSSRAVAATPTGLATTVSQAAVAGAAAGAGIVGYCLQLMSTTKVALTVAVAGSLAVVTAGFKWAEASRESESATAAQSERVAWRERLARLQAATAAAEQELAARAAEAAKASAVATPVVVRPAAAPIDDVNARARDLQTQLREKDPQYLVVTGEYRRRLAREQFAPLAGLGFTTEQIERAVALYGEVLPRALPQAIRDNFDPETAARLNAFLAREPVRNFVKDFSAQLYYLPERMTPPQADELMRIVEESSPLRSKGDFRGPSGAFRQSLDWNQILSRAEPLLTPGQMQGLRGFAASTAFNKAIADANAEIAAQKK